MKQIINAEYMQKIDPLKHNSTKTLYWLFRIQILYSFCRPERRVLKKKKKTQFLQNHFI